MKERPILFTGAMVRALLAGTKTQTRRIMKPQPFSNGYYQPSGRELRCHNHYLAPDALLWKGGCELTAEACPYGMPGDRLWVRETVAIERWTREFGDEPPLPKDRPWKHKPPAHYEDCDAWHWPHYRASDPDPALCCERENCRACENDGYGPHWQPSIHMPRWASRITLEITDIRVQRLQEISEEDAIAEGIVNGLDDEGWIAPGVHTDIDCSSPSLAYRDLWQSINGAGSWDANPWVWAVSFKRVETTPTKRSDAEGQ